MNMMTPDELTEKIKGAAAGQLLFDVYKHQQKQLARLSYLSFELLAALDTNDPAQVEPVREALSRYMLIETNLALNYGEKP